MVNAKVIINQLKSLRNPEKAIFFKRFFKTGPGEYAENDKFLGIVVPEIRKIVKNNWQEISLADAALLVQNEYHEVRLCGLLILVQKFQNGDEQTQQKIYEFYTTHTEFINNWDLIDLTADHIVGAYLADKPKTLLKVFAKSDSLWQRRIAMLATFYDIKQGKAKEALYIAHLLIYDKYNLIQKAVGWMLREIGKRASLKAEEAFLDEYAATMPRTALRYAIEHFSPEKKLHYMQLKTKKDGETNAK